MITLQLKLAKSWTEYSINFHELVSKKSEIIYKDDFLTVKTLPLDHRVYTNGFLFITSSKKNIGKNEIINYIEKLNSEFTN